MSRERRRVRDLLAQQLLPVRDQQRIMQSIEDVVTLCAQTNDSALKQEAAQSLEDLEDRCARYLANPRTQDAVIRDALEEVFYQANAAREELWTARPRRLLVPRATSAQQQSLQTLGVETLDFRHIDYSAILSQAATPEISRALAASGLGGTLEKTYHVRPRRAHDETPWNQALIGAPAAWQRSRGEGVRVAVIDTGCDYTHPELRGRFTAEKGYNFVDNNEDPQDDHGHGTHCAGIVAGEAIGAAPKATLYALKFLSASGSGTEVDLIRALDWTIDHDMHVISGSFGSGHDSPAEQAACQAVADHGILFAAAAGNNGSSRYEYPASYDTVISVAAIDRDKRRAPFSQYNDQVELSAPGVSVRSSVPGGYDTYDGTSMATPHVAGSLALVLGAGMTDARSVLAESAEDLGPRDQYGHGLVRPDRALKAAYRRAG